MRHIRNIFRLGVKEFQSFSRDTVLMILILYAFSLGIAIASKSLSSELHNAPIAFIDEDHSMLSQRIVSAFYGPYFTSPVLINSEQADVGMDGGVYTFVVDIPPEFEKDVLSGKHPEVQVNIDATRMTQAGVGAGYVQTIIRREVSEFLNPGSGSALPVTLAVRTKYNPNLESSWYSSVTELVNNIALFSIILTGAALIREKEHGTLEHLLVMPLNTIEIMLAKVWSMGLIILVCAGLSLNFMVEDILGTPVAGSVPLFLCGALILLFATSSMGILMGTIARTMPQFGLVFILTILPLQVLSGGVTPYESMVETVQNIMKLAPTSHFVKLAHGVIFRGAGIEVVWPEMVFMFIIGLVFFNLSLMLLRRSLAAS